MFWIEEIKTTPGPDIHIDCPACRALAAPASTFEQQTRDWYFGVLPILSSTYTKVICTRCGISLNATVKPTELLEKTPQELASVLYVSTTFVQKSLAIIALLLAIFPFVGWAMSLIAIIANWKTPAWPRAVSKIAVFVSILGVLLVLFVFIMATLEERGFLGNP